ncbi:hypothetical protein F4805DRAFT_469864 [Annulohypoxylon moriforme]|nr:hypothetical protein F4805DRAFT_469864 [Annulohypoxylon moriforme]
MEIKMLELDELITVLEIRGPVVAEAQRQLTVQQLLPTCQRCRRLRRKCDTQLPSCRVCEKAGAECTFHDHALKQTLPRAYVHSLLSRIEYLETIKNGAANPRLSQQQEQQHSPQQTEQPTNVEPNLAAPSPLPTPSFDVIIPSASAAGRSRYWGSSSVFALTVVLLEHAAKKGFVSQEDVAGHEGEGPDMEASDDESFEPLNSPSATTNNHSNQVYPLDPAAEVDIEALIRLYLISLNTMYRFVDEAETRVDLQTYLALRRQPGFSCHTLHGEQAHRFFRITMMCAISCANQARHRPQRTAQCLAYYADAVTCVEEVTSEATPASLQALLLLIVFCLFYPRKGDIWKLLDYACRLTIELGYHTEETEPADQLEQFPSAQEGMAPFGTTSSGGGILSEPEAAATISSPAEASQARSKLRRSTFWGLYAIERIVGQLFGRGSDLPETIITAEYPSSLHFPSGFSPLAVDSQIGSSTTLGVDQPTLQTMGIGHHYRLVYLRSEIFRALYLPASPPNLGLDWLKEKHTTLYAWRRELAVGDDLAGVATLTCDVGYDATMCFLFQPLLMKALRATTRERQHPTNTVQQQQPNSQTTLNGITEPPQSLPTIPSTTATNEGNNENPTSSEQSHVVASDPFHSAIHTIQTYEKIIRAPERSTLGSYPMTFMSAHYIYLASSTLLAYALLRLDGRAVMLKPMCEMDADASLDGGVDGANVVEELDWGAFVDVSSSCLILLSWCSERWPGMLRMLKIHQKLFARVTRELIRLGVVR